MGTVQCRESGNLLSHLALLPNDTVLYTLDWPTSRRHVHGSPLFTPLALRSVLERQMRSRIKPSISTAHPALWHYERARMHAGPGDSRRPRCACAACMQLLRPVYATGGGARDANDFRSNTHAQTFFL